MMKYEQREVDPSASGEGVRHRDPHVNSICGIATLLLLRNGRLFEE